MFCSVAVLLSWTFLVSLNILFSSLGTIELVKSLVRNSLGSLLTYKLSKGLYKKNTPKHMPAMQWNCQVEYYPDGKAPLSKKTSMDIGYSNLKPILSFWNIGD